MMMRKEEKSRGKAEDHLLSDRREGVFLLNEVGVGVWRRVGRVLSVIRKRRERGEGEMRRMDLRDGRTFVTVWFEECADEINI